MNTIDYLLNSKYLELWFAVILELEPSIRNFKNQLRSYFSKQQKEVIYNINKGKIYQYNFYNVNDSVKKLSAIYINNIGNILSKSYDRCVKESGVEEKEIANFIIDKYKTDYLVKIVEDIETTTITKLNDLYIECNYDLKEFKSKVNDFYNKYCKKFRSGVISKTESFRVYNYFYFTYMSLNGFRYKTLITGILDKSSKVYHLNGVKKFYLDEFELKDGTRFLFPPSHPNDISVLLCTKT